MTKPNASTVWADDHGTAVVEYALITLMAVVAIIGLFPTLNAGLRVAFATVVTQFPLAH